MVIIAPAQQKYKEDRNMFEKFGEFDSYEELNKAAAGQLEQGDIEALKVLASENGIDEMDIQDYADGTITELVTPFSAAVAKLELEAEDLKTEGLVKDWKNCAIQLCTEDEELCLAVRKKGKRLSACMGKLLEYAFKNKNRLDDRIVKAANLKPPVCLGAPSLGEAENIIYLYYTGHERQEGSR